jgi:hypothetical protein
LAAASGVNLSSTTMHKEPADPLYDQRVDIERVGPAPVRAATFKPRTEQLDFEEGSVEAALSFW